MEMSFKQELYFVIQIDNKADRTIISRAVRDLLEPELEKLIEKIKLSKEDKKKFKDLTGHEADISLMPKRKYIEKIS